MGSNFSSLNKWIRFEKTLAKHARPAAKAAEAKSVKASERWPRARPRSRASAVRFMLFRGSSPNTFSIMSSTSLLVPTCSR